MWISTRVRQTEYLYLVTWHLCQVVCAEVCVVTHSEGQEGREERPLVVSGQFGQHAL